MADKDTAAIIEGAIRARIAAQCEKRKRKPAVLIAMGAYGPRVLLMRLVVYPGNAVIVVDESGREWKSSLLCLLFLFPISIA